MPKIDLQEAAYTLDDSSMISALADVLTSERDKRRYRGKSVVTCRRKSPSNGWTCTAPYGHADYLPHMAAAGTCVFAIWYDPGTLEKYGVTLNKSANARRRIEIQGKYYDALDDRAFDTMPDVTFALKERTGKPMCNTISAGGLYTCTLPKGHADYFPHMAGTSYRIIALWYDTKTLKRYGRLPAGTGYPERNV